MTGGALLINHFVSSLHSFCKDNHWYKDFKPQEIYQFDAGMERTSPAISYRLTLDARAHRHWACNGYVSSASAAPAMLRGGSAAGCQASRGAAHNPISHKCSHGEKNAYQAQMHVLSIENLRSY
eukprot:925245-Pelagomonas_calceolata.AAC.4